jgi:hypothetical protein
VNGEAASLRVSRADLETSGRFGSFGIPAPPPACWAGVPASCEVCGEDTDIHQWWDLDASGQPVNCDRNSPGPP